MASSIDGDHGDDDRGGDNDAVRDAVADSDDGLSGHSDEINQWARKLFAGDCTFIYGAAPGSAFPPPQQPEVAFAGRSNVGKSSLLNALAGRKQLARTSNTPGRTQQINFFDLGGTLTLVDLPGYGYARASKTDIAAWNRSMHDYLAGRPNLVRLFVLIDGRHGLKSADREMMTSLDPLAVIYQIVLTKCDKASASDIAARMTEIEAELKRHPAAFPKIVATSARKSDGLDILRSTIAALAEVPANR